MNLTAFCFHSFNPFDYALDVKNKSLEDASKSKLSLNSDETWYARFIAYYTTLDSHILNVYKEKKDDRGKPLVERSRETITGVRSDKKSPIFDSVLQSRNPYLTVLDRKNYGIDIIVKAFPIFSGEKMMGIVAYTQDITSYADQKILIENGLNNIQLSTKTILEEVESVREISTNLNNFSKDAGEFEVAIKVLISDITDLKRTLLISLGQLQFLSFNTRIEASHAGEFGKGFSVIAMESYPLESDFPSGSRN